MGWVLDVYVEGSNAVLWVKLEDGKAIRLTDRYRPDFYIELGDCVNPEDVAQTISLHPLVHRVSIEEKYTSILSREKSRVIHVFARDIPSFKTVRRDVEKLRIVKSWFNIDLYHFQRYLFSKTFAPTNKVEAEGNDEWKLLDIAVINDSDEIRPPPFTSLLFEVSVRSENLTPNVKQDPVSRIALQGDRFESLEGAEADILTGFASCVRELDPDFLVANDCEENLHYILERARVLNISLQLGRELAKGYTPKNERSPVKGRALADLDDFLEYGVPGITELSRFTLAPPTFSAKWPAGKTIDARQSFEALRKDILVPKLRGFPRFSMTAREILEKDKGGLLFSPVVGLHENVAELDFESMFPNIIIRHNISYETVTPTDVDLSRRGFLSEVVGTVLDRRLRFKHLRKRFPRENEEYGWCDQRQKALKSVLVCIYGFSGCFANRFNNVAAYNMINEDSRRILVQAVNLCLNRGFEVLYGNVDSLFVKRRDATQEDYEDLAKLIQGETGLPISLDNHYKFVVFMRQETRPDVEAMNHFFGKLTNGELNYRGIELRRRDCPAFLKEFQKQLIEILFDARDAKEVVDRQVAKARAFVRDTYLRVVRGEVDPFELVISKRLHRDVNTYRSLFPHVVAGRHLARRGKKLEEYGTVDYVFMSAKNSNPMRRVLPVAMMDKGQIHYDRVKYGKLLLDVADTVLKSFPTNQTASLTLDAFKESQNLSREASTISGAGKRVPPHSLR